MIHKIENTTSEDLDTIFGFFDQSIKYQEERGYPTWKNYDKNTLRRDVENKNQYKIIINNEIAMAFSAVYSDKLMWQELDRGDGVYLHRIVVNPLFKGKKLFGTILDWSLAHAKEKNIPFVRMDTWANNPNIIEYYKGFGFKFIRNYDTGENMDLPVHNRNIVVALLEYKVV